MAIRPGRSNRASVIRLRMYARYLRRLPSRAHPGNEPALPLDHLGLLLRIELDGRVEVSEEDDQSEQDQDVPPADPPVPAAEVAVDPAIDRLPARPCPTGWRSSSVRGYSITDVAKITGMTPAVFTLSGM